MDMEQFVRSWNLNWQDAHNNGRERALQNLSSPTRTRLKSREFATGEERMDSKLERGVEVATQDVLRQDPLKERESGENFERRSGEREYGWPAQ